MSKRIKTMLLAGVGVTHPMTIQALNSGLRDKPKDVEVKSEAGVANEHSR